MAAAANQHTQRTYGQTSATVAQETAPHSPSELVLVFQQPPPVNVHACERTFAADNERSSTPEIPLQPFKSSAGEAVYHFMHNCIPHFDRAGQHWTQMYHRLPVSSAVDNSARTGVVERLRRTLCTRVLMHKVNSHPAIVYEILQVQKKVHCVFLDRRNDFTAAL